MAQNVKTNKYSELSQKYGDPWIWGIYITLVIISIIESYSASSREIVDEGLYMPLIKQCAFEQSLQCWCLCDSSKFDRVTPITFAPFSAIQIITDKIENPAYARSGNVEIAEPD